MSKGHEKRKYSRVEARIKVSFKSVHELSLEYTRNISAGGIFLKTDRQLDPNAEISLTLHLPNELGECIVKGKVVRLMTLSHPTDPDKQLFGVGIRFIELSESARKAIEEAISSLSEGKTSEE